MKSIGNDSFDTDGFLPFVEEQPSNKMVSQESVRLMEGINCLKSGLSLVNKKLSQAIQFGGTQAVKDFLLCTDNQILNIQEALAQNFFFPILGLRKKEISDNSFVVRSIDSIATEIKADLLSLAVKAYKIDPLLVPLFFGMPEEECKKIKNFFPTEFYEYAKNSEWTPTVQPFVQLIGMEKVEFFKFLSLLICRRSKTDLVPLEMPSLSNLSTLDNAKNIGVDKPKLNFHKVDTLIDAGFLINQGLDRSLASIAANIWTLRLRNEGEEKLPNRRSKEDLKFKDISSEAPYRIYLNLYNYLASTKDNDPIDFRRTAVAFQIISQLFEESDCWKNKEVVSLNYTLAYSAALYQTFNWLYLKGFLNVYDKCSINDLSYKKFMRIRPGSFNTWMTEIVHCKKCSNDFLACNVFSLRKSCPICGEKQTI